jgi:hypothetical protein
MTKKLVVALLAVLSTSTSFAANRQPVPVYTFVCTVDQNGSGPCPNGGVPAALLQGSDGNFYGTTETSSLLLGSAGPGGTVFSLTPGGTLTVLHTFLPGPNENYPNGSLPGLLLEGPDGKLYGAAVYGGIDGCKGYCGDGMLFRLNKDGSDFEIVHKFCSETNCTDGVGVTALAVAKNGNIYGTDFGGGIDHCGGGGCGAIFQVTPSTGEYKVVFNFNGTSDGYEPVALMPVGALLYGSDGKLFTYNPKTGIFKIINETKSLRVSGRQSGGAPGAIGPDGELYGFHSVWGQDGIGLSEVRLNGKDLKLFPFYNSLVDGGQPDGLLLATDKNFWVADFHGATGYGDVITLSPADGSLLKTLAAFGTSSPVGAYPVGLIQANDGILWGLTYAGGTAGEGQTAEGTIFSLNAGLPHR